MGVITDGKIYIHGNFTKAKRYKNGRPKNYFDRDYKAIIPFNFKWREKIGKVECTCVEILECYQPYYGWDWYHEDKCALIQLIKQKPQLTNLWCYQRLPHIASSE